MICFVPHPCDAALKKCDSWTKENVIIDSLLNLIYLVTDFMPGKLSSPA